jgi:hypothetical protein
LVVYCIQHKEEAYSCFKINLVLNGFICKGSQCSQGMEYEDKGKERVVRGPANVSAHKKFSN